jgi:hypothetical protein
MREGTASQDLLSREKPYQEYERKKKHMLAEKVVVIMPSSNQRRGARRSATSDASLRTGTAALFKTASSHQIYIQKSLGEPVHSSSSSLSKMNPALILGRLEAVGLISSSSSSSALNSPPASFDLIAGWSVVRACSSSWSALSSPVPAAVIGL